MSSWQSFLVAWLALCAALYFVFLVADKGGRLWHVLRCQCDGCSANRRMSRYLVRRSLGASWMPGWACLMLAGNTRRLLWLLRRGGERLAIPFTAGGPFDGQEVSPMGRTGVWAHILGAVDPVWFSGASLEEDGVFYEFDPVRWELKFAGMGPDPTLVEHGEAA